MYAVHATQPNQARPPCKSSGLYYCVRYMTQPTREEVGEHDHAGFVWGDEVQMMGNNDHEMVPSVVRKYTVVTELLTDCAIDTMIQFYLWIQLTSAHTSGEDALTPREQLPLLALNIFFTTSPATTATIRRTYHRMYCCVCVQWSGQTQRNL